MDVLELARSLVDIPSVTGEEATVARWLADQQTPLPGAQQDLVAAVRA